MAGMIGLWMNLGRNVLEHEHHAIALYDAPKILTLPISPACVRDFKAKLRLVEVKAPLKVVDDKERSY
ncbi:MAG TPA: hypothetical protein VGG15_04790 [Terriglobales bacterium]